MLERSTHLPSREKNFEAISFTRYASGFGYVSFAVFASSIWLPTSMQDSLHSGIGSPSMTGLSPARSVRLYLAHDPVFDFAFLAFKYAQMIATTINIKQWVKHKKPPRTEIEVYQSAA
jgi:hypothetical protein